MYGEEINKNSAYVLKMAGYVMEKLQKQGEKGIMGANRGEGWGFLGGKKLNKKGNE